MTAADDRKARIQQALQDWAKKKPQPKRDFAAEHRRKKFKRPKS